MMNIKEQVDSVETREDLIKLIRTLAENFDAEPSSWENGTVSGYLFALAAWAEDMDGYFINSSQTVPSRPDWKTMGQMLAAAKVYE